MNRYLTIVMVVLGVLAGCVFVAPTPPPVSPRPDAEVVSTTGKALDPDTAATLIAGSSYDIPEGKYLLVKAEEVERICSGHCDCPPPDPGNWSQLSPSEQGAVTRDFIKQGAIGFVDFVEHRSSCPDGFGYHHERRAAIKELPFAWSFRTQDYSPCTQTYAATFRNSGLLDEKDSSELSAPAPDP